MLRRRSLGVGSLASAALVGLAWSIAAVAQRPDPFGERYYQGPSGSGVPAGATVRDLTSQLALEGRRLVDDVNYELAGTSVGPQAMAQAVALSQSLDLCDELASRGAEGSSRFRTAVLQVEPALLALQGRLNNPPGLAPSASRELFRVGRLYGDLRQIAGVEGPGGPPGRPGPGGQLAARQAAQRVAEDVTQTQLQLQSSGLANYSPYNRVARDLVTLGSTLQGIVELIDREAGDALVLGELNGAQSRADRVNGVLGNDPNVPAGLEAAWSRALRGLGRLSAIVAGGTMPPVVVPPVVRPPVLPPPIVRPPTVVPPLPPAYGGPLAVLDQWLGEVDQLVAIQQALVATAPQGFMVLGDARELRSSLSRLRQRVGSGAPPPAFQGAFRQVERDYGKLRDRVDRIAGGRSGPNIDLVRSMQRHLEQFRAYARL